MVPWSMMFAAALIDEAVLASKLPETIAAVVATELPKTVGAIVVRYAAHRRS